MTDTCKNHRGPYGNTIARLYHALRAKEIAGLHRHRRADAWAAASAPTSALFSVVDAVLLRPLQFKNASQTSVGLGECPLCEGGAVSPSDFVDYRAQNQSFEHYGARAVGDSLFNLTGTDKPIQINGSMITAGYFEPSAFNPAMVVCLLYLMRKHQIRKW